MLSATVHKATCAYIKGGKCLISRLWSTVLFIVKISLHKVFIIPDVVAGDYLGDLIVKLKDDYNGDLKKIQVSGHSLGAQVGGATGRRVQNVTGSKIARITGMDPARPLFEGIEFTGTGRLTKDDAELVVIVHSDAGVLGYLHDAGHIDFYPNGGTATQPGCLGDDITGGSEYNNKIKIKRNGYENIVNLILYNKQYS